MSDIPPPLPLRTPPDSAGPSWWATNWKWATPALVLVCVGTALGFAVMVLSLMKSSGAYQESMLLLRSSKEVIAELGEPIEASILVLGQVKTGSRGGMANLRFGVQGPKGRASVFVLASKSSEQWEFERVTVTITKSEKRIEVVQPERLKPRATLPSRPNKSLQPTATAVMPPAAQEIMPTVAWLSIKR
jgi:hypothetical protein